MTARLGIDLVRVAAVSDSIAQFGDRYLSRVYTPTEIADCTGPAGPEPARLAARFAAKEATIKALRPEDNPLPWLSIEVVRERAGAVGVALTGLAAEHAARTGVGSVELSITHEDEYAAAVALTRGDDDT